MTVEMEKPFVWPEIPDLAPWGKTERKKEENDAVASAGVQGENQQRASARKLREQVQNLFKREEVLTNEAIVRKKAAGVALTAEEQKQEDERLKREAELRSMTSLQLWEEKRTGKVITSDERSRFTIKV